jgi:hypothetical protein
LRVCRTKRLYWLCLNGTLNIKLWAFANKRSEGF